jgi:hypothetical protein
MYGKKELIKMDKNYVNMCCHTFDADTIEKIRSGHSSETRRSPGSVANAVHQMMGAYLYCQKHGIKYNEIWTEKKEMQ